MQIIHTIRELREQRKTVGKVVFVPTMSNLHEGYLALAREAKKRIDNVVVNIFVSRLQFGQGEDFDKYPRISQQDAGKLAGEGVAIVFVPDEKELYPNVEQRLNVGPPHLQNELCGKFRLGHFRGVATVVTRLFNIVQPDTACFGKKNYQQLATIKGFVEDLNLNIEIVPVNTGHASDGLALSSRNQYLSGAECVEAPRLYQELQNIATALKNDNLDYAQLEAECIHRLAGAGWMVDYVEIRHAHSLVVAHVDDKESVVLAATRLGTTRLIGNLEVVLA